MSKLFANTLTGGRKVGKNRRRTSKFFTNALRVGTATVEYHEKTPRKRVDRTGRENEGGAMRRG